MNEATDTIPDEFYERIGTTTRWGRYLAAKEEAIIHRGLEYAGARGMALDVGCGGGRWSKILADRGWQMTCVDIDENALQFCRRKVPAATCIRVPKSDQQFPCDSNSQRVLLCMEAPEVIEKPWFAQEARRVLADRGHVIGFYMNPSSWRGWAWDPVRSATGAGEQYYTGPAYAVWRQNFVSNGFEMLHEESYAWAPFGRTSNSPLIPAATAIESILGLKHLLRFAPWILFVARKKSARS